MRVGSPPPSVSLRALFVLFLKIGLTFGSGTGMSAVLQDELVHKRKAIERGEFMVLYGLARLVPSGSMTALAVAIGYRYQGFVGTLVALVVVSAFRLGQEFFTPSLELLLAIGAGAGVLLLGLNPSLMLLAGGLIGAIALRDVAPEDQR